MKKKTKEILQYIGIVLLAIVTIGLIAFIAIRFVGKREIEKKELDYQPTLVTAETIEAQEKEKEHWQEGWIKYNGKVYQYNDDITTFLFMGIDKQGKVKEVAEGTNGGQADALFLAVLNPDDKTIKIVAINRNTMADVDIYNEYGDYVTTTKAQIAIQHGFGNGVEKSCEYQTAAVSKLFYNMPIHGYAAINMKAIEVINDTVGGVSLVALSDVYDDANRKQVSEGDNVILNGKQAYWYVRDRDMEEFASADMRLARQKQYLTALVSQTIGAVKSDSSIISKLYDSVTPYMTTDITFQEVAYLAPKVAGYSFDASAISTIAGETVMGEQFEEYNIDEEALYELIINTFYEEVNVK